MASKGKSNPIINLNSYGKANIIFGLGTDGSWMAILSNLTTDSLKFWRFLFILKKFVELLMRVKIEDVRNTLDNAPVNLSLKIRKVSEVLGMKLLFLPLLSSFTSPSWIGIWNEQEDTSKSKENEIN